jgi:hypothetical protein
MNAGISWTLPVIAAAASWMAFGFYALCMVGQLVRVLMIMPETKGISLEKIQEELVAARAGSGNKFKYSHIFPQMGEGYVLARARRARLIETYAS